MQKPPNTLLAPPLALVVAVGAIAAPAHSVHFGPVPKEEVATEHPLHTPHHEPVAPAPYRPQMVGTTGTSVQVATGLQRQLGASSLGF